MATAPVRHRFTVKELLKMDKAGLFDDRRVELIEGEIIDMAPINPPHAGSVASLNFRLGEGLRGRALIWPQNPVWLTAYSLPQPDLVLLRWRDDFYQTRHPRPKDVLLVIEVAHTTLRYDRNVKVPLYGRAGIPEVWVWDVQRHRVLVYRDPIPEGYRTTFEVGRDGSVSPQAFPDLVIPVASILG